MPCPHWKGRGRGRERRRRDHPLWTHRDYSSDTGSPPCHYTSPQYHCVSHLYAGERENNQIIHEQLYNTGILFLLKVD